MSAAPRQTEAQRLADYVADFANEAELHYYTGGIRKAAALLRSQDELLVQAELSCQLIVSAFDALAPVSSARQEPLQINAARQVIAAIRAHREAK